MIKVKKVYTLLRWTDNKAKVVGSYASKIEAEDHIPFWDSLFHDYTISEDFIPASADLSHLQNVINSWNKEGK